MNNPPANDPNDLVTKALRGTLSEEESREFQRRLEQEPELRKSFAEEQNLDRIIERLPNAPLSSNFTSLVLQSIHSEERKPARSTGGWRWTNFRLARVAAGLATFAVAGVLAIKQFRQAEQKEMARTVSAFSEVATAIAPEQTSPATLFQDFDAIQQLSLPAESELDLELLVALQK